MEIYEAIGGTIVGSTLTYNYTKTGARVAFSNKFITLTEQFTWVNGDHAMRSSYQDPQSTLGNAQTNPMYNYNFQFIYGGGSTLASCTLGLVSSRKKVVIKSPVGFPTAFLYYHYGPGFSWNIVEDVGYLNTKAIGKDKIWVSIDGEEWVQLGQSGRAKYVNSYGDDGRRAVNHGGSIYINAAHYYYMYIDPDYNNACDTIDFAIRDTNNYPSHTFNTQCSYINTLASSSNLIGGVQQFSLNAPDSVGFSLDASGSSTYVVKQNGLVRTDWSYCNVSILI